jgi:hypothetical protein
MTQIYHVPTFVEVNKFVKGKVTALVPLTTHLALRASPLWQEREQRGKLPSSYKENTISHSGSDSGNIY